jgi:hypothetical protein
MSMWVGERREDPEGIRESENEGAIRGGGDWKYIGNILEQKHIMTWTFPI